MFSSLKVRRKFIHPVLMKLPVDECDKIKNSDH